MTLKKAKIENEISSTIIVIICLIGPIGVIIGMLLKTIIIHIDIIFMGFVSGSCLFVSASEVMIEEFTINFYKRAKFTSFFGGIFILVLLIYFLL